MYIETERCACENSKTYEEVMWRSRVSPHVWVFIKGGCSRRGGAVDGGSINKTAYNIM